MSPALNLDYMNISDKFLLLEKLWENMSQDVLQKGFSPKWHLDELSRRELNIENNKSKFNDFEDTKARLHKIVS